MAQWSPRLDLKLWKLLDCKLTSAPLQQNQQSAVIGSQPGSRLIQERFFLYNFI